MRLLYATDVRSAAITCATADELLARVLGGGK